MYTNCGLPWWLRRNLPAMQETQVRSLDWAEENGEGNGNPLQYSCLENPMDRGAWRVLWTEEPGELQSMGSQRVGYD